MSELVKVFFIILVFSFSGCSLSDYLDPVSSWFDEDKEIIGLKLSDEEIAKGYILCCQSIPLTDSLVIEIE